MKQTKAISMLEHNEKLIKIQISAAKQLMTAVSKLPWTKDSIVAGGAPRDWYMGKPAKDIDIFLLGSTISQTQLMEFMEREGFGEIKLARRKHSAESDEAATYYTNPMIKWVFDGQLGLRPSIYDGTYPVKFQIVVTQQCESVAALLATFTVEISKFTWNHLTGKITGEPGALLDVQHKTLTQTYHDITQGRYVQKIRAKFPGHKFVDMTAVKKASLPLAGLGVAARNITPKEQGQLLDASAGKVQFEADKFAYWLQGFFEMTSPTFIDERQTQIIKDHLALVFNKATPDRSAPTASGLIETNEPALLPGYRCDEQATYTGHSLFRGENAQQTRVVPPTAILPLKTYVSC